MRRRDPDKPGGSSRWQNCLFVRSVLGLLSISASEEMYKRANFAFPGIEAFSAHYFTKKNYCNVEDSVEQNS